MNHGVTKETWIRGAFLAAGWSPPLSERESETEPFRLARIAKSLPPGVLPSCTVHGGEREVEVLEITKVSKRYDVDVFRRWLIGCMAEYASARGYYAHRDDGDGGRWHWRGHTIVYGSYPDIVEALASACTDAYERSQRTRGGANG